MRPAATRAVCGEQVHTQVYNHAEYNTGVHIMVVCMSYNRIEEYINV